MSGQTIVKGNINLSDDGITLLQRQYVYDPIGLAWVPAQQASGGAASTVNQGTAAAGSSAWPVTVTEDTTHTKVEPGDATNKAIRVNVVAGGAGDGSILDGITSTLKATVAHYTNSNPLTVTLRDTNGDYVAAGAGTQYTEDAAAAADPIGGVNILVRKDLPSTTVSTDGDNIAQRGSNFGAAYHTLVSTTGILLGIGDSGNTSPATLRVIIATDQPQLTNKLLVTPDSVALPANQSVNIAQMNGTTVTMNAGTGGVGTQRVYLATDQPALTNKLLVTPDSVALPANQSVNVSQMNSTTVTMGAGTSNVGVQRVIIATDQPAFTNKLLVTPDSVALPANQSVNVAQMNGTTVSMGAGVTGVGTQRAILASDSSAIANWGQGATGTTVPTGAQYIGLNAVTALPTAVATGQMSALMGDVYGRQVNILGTIRTLRGSQNTTISNTTVETTILTGTTGIFADPYVMLITNTSTTASCRVDIRDTTGGGIIIPVWAPTGQTVGFVIPGSPWPQTSVGGNWTAQCSAVVTDIRIAVLFDKNK